MVLSLEEKNQYEERENARACFLRAQGWGDADIVPFQSDASRRRYWRLVRETERCLLMDMPHHPEENFKGYLDIGMALRAADLSAPDILALDPTNQFALIEDFGDSTYTKLLNDSADPSLLYQLAVEAISQMQHHAKPPLNTPLYDQTRLMDEVLRFVDWYVPVYQNAPAQPGQRAEFADLFQQTLQHLPSLPGTLVLRDFHVDNLMMLPERNGLQRCGILDFQDARIGSPAYDLVSLIEDARRDLDPDLAKQLSDLYRQLHPAMNHAAFMQHFYVMGAQRHGRLLGQFIRLWLRDSKPSYLQFLPRVARQFWNAIQHPALDNVQKWVQKNVPDLLKFTPSLDQKNHLQSLINRNLDQGV